MSLGMYGQGQGAGRPSSIWNKPNTKSSPYLNPTPKTLGMPQGNSSWGSLNSINPQNINQSTYSMPETNWTDYANSALGSIGMGGPAGIGGLLSGISGLGGLLGYNNLDLGEQRKQLGALSGNFQERGQEAWDFGKQLREGKGQFYDTAKNEIGRQMDVGMDAQRTNAMVGVNSASAYRRSLGDLQRKMYEQLGSSMNQMYATGLQQSAQYGGLASDLWRNRIGAESAIADMRKSENESSNALPSQLMNMSGGLLGSLFGGILG